jgi:hypothetical protein
MISDLRDTVTLAPWMRTILLEEICRRFHIINYCNHFFNLDLKQMDGAGHRGTCPWCCKKEVFMCNKTTGTCYCESCGILADFFDIITKHWNFDLSFSLKLVAWQLEKATEFAEKLHIQAEPGPGGDL